jgi:hypothetical protein
LTEQQQTQVTNLIAQNIDVFATDMSQIGCTDFITHKIQLNNTKPVSQRPYPMTPLKKEVIDKHVRDLLSQGVIERSNSQYNVPVVLVLIKGGTPGTQDHKQYRMCVDYRLINTHIIQALFPLPRINEILDTIGEKHPHMLSSLL